jgi:hypothetical protein
MWLGSQVSLRQEWGQQTSHILYYVNNQQNELQCLLCVFYSQFPHQHVSAAIATIFRVMLLLQEDKGTNVVSCVAVTT